MKKTLKKEDLPRHVAIIMDGNGRWAKNKLLPRSGGHKAGADNFKSIVDHSSKIGINYLTVFAFSTENWKRPKKEIDFLMRLFKIYLKDALDEFSQKNIKVVFLGKRENLSKGLIKLINEVEIVSKNHTGMTLNIALNYGSKLEITEAVRSIVKKVNSQNIGTSCITEGMISKHLYTKDSPDVDLVIRTGGEKRISNFLLWQLAYSEFIFSDTLWPDFNSSKLDDALLEFSLRSRRFGGVKNGN